MGSGIGLLGLGMMNDCCSHYTYAIRHKRKRFYGVRFFFLFFFVRFDLATSILVQRVRRCGVTADGEIFLENHRWCVPMSGAKQAT